MNRGGLACLLLTVPLLLSCGEKKAGVTQVDSLTEAISLAQKQGSFIIAEFYSDT
jgi:hypothetical protein